jgi:AcrR family transcriptional regulator
MVSGRLPGPERRRQILSVAQSVLAGSGFHGATMTDIADAAGVTKPVLYQHFTSKRHLYGTLLQDIGSRLQSAVIEAASAADSPRERAEAGMRAYARFVEQHEDGFKVLFSGDNRQDEEWAAIISEVERSLAHAVASMIDVPAIDGKRRQLLAHGIIGLAESMMRFARSGDEMAYDHEQLVSDLTRLTWSGLRGLDG